MSALVLASLLWGAGPASCPELPSPPPERGVALGLFSADPDWRYDGLLEEIAETGATHVSVVWVWWQEGLSATEIAPKPGWSATEAQVRAAMEKADALGLHVTLFPIVRLIRPGPGEWRGKIAPADEDAWWSSYDAFVLRAAALAAQTDTERLSVGSELLTRERMRGRWARLIETIRLRYPALELMYSANWDHYRPVRFWDLVDVVGLTAYWEVGRGLPPRGGRARVAALEAAWRGPRRELARLSADFGREIVLTEVGYPSLEGGSRYPWDETREAPVDLEEQRDAYEAFARALGGRPFLRGVYFWNWFGFGGPEDGDYTPRRKPAARVLECWFTAPRRGASPSPARGEGAPPAAAPPRARSRSGRPRPR